MRLSVVHETRYDYQPVVEHAQHLACLRPIDTPCQRVLEHHLDITPAPSHLSHSRDAFGNWRSFFELQIPHAELTVVSRTEVLTQAPAQAPSTIPWESVRDRYQYRASARWDAAVEFCFASPLAPRHAEFVDWARPSFEPGRPLIDVARDLTRRIHAELTYAPQSTEVHTSPREALAQKRGVCQDFAHILIACLRSRGLPARYVSGYLLTQPPPGQARLIGSDASHAWASVFLPDLAAGGLEGGWYDLDPTNDRCGRGSPGEDYVSVATGRDFGDVSPIRGVIHGGARHTLAVGVTVAPAPDDVTGATEPSDKESP